MTDYVDTFRRYWRRRYDEDGQLALENAARDPANRWLVADGRSLSEGDDGIDPDELRQFPDEVISDARDGFRALVDDADVPASEAPFAHLAVHFVGVGQVRGAAEPFESIVEDANELRTLSNVPLAKPTSTDVETSRRTYRCPAGHETTLSQPLWAQRTVESCGKPECSNEVHSLDGETVLRRKLSFAVGHRDDSLNCVAAGRYAADTRSRTAIRDADRLFLTGIPRPIVRDGEVESIFQVLHAAPA